MTRWSLSVHSPLRLQAAVKTFKEGFFNLLREPSIAGTAAPTHARLHLLQQVALSWEVRSDRRGHS